MILTQTAAEMGPKFLKGKVPVGVFCDTQDFPPGHEHFGDEEMSIRELAERAEEAGNLVIAAKFTFTRRKNGSVRVVVVGDEYDDIAAALERHKDRMAYA